MNIDHLISSFGYWAVFAFVGLESLGIPLPGETALIAAGAYAGHTGRLNVWLIFLVASAAAIIGDNIGFWIGDKGGYALLRKYGRYIRFDEAKMKVGRYIFDRRGGSVVFFGRFVSVLRTYAAFLAGTNRMRWRKFLVFNAAGGIIWAAIYTFLSYALGNSLRNAVGHHQLRPRRRRGGRHRDRHRDRAAQEQPARGRRRGRLPRSPQRLTPGRPPDSPVPSLRGFGFSAHFRALEGAFSCREITLLPNKSSGDPLRHGACVKTPACHHAERPPHRPSAAEVGPGGREHMADRVIEPADGQGATLDRRHQARLDRLHAPGHVHGAEQCRLGRGEGRAEEDQVRARLDGGDCGVRDVVAGGGHGPGRQAVGDDQAREPELARGAAR